MRILVIGSNGLLGSDLCSVLQKKHEVYALNQTSTDVRVERERAFIADITQYDAIAPIISKINPDLVINSAAISNVDECERKPDCAYRVNAIAVRNIAVACQRFDTVLCHISTDYVFDGEHTPGGGYSEFDAVGPVNTYGKSKLAGERYIGELLNKFYILRTSMLFGLQRETFAGMIVKSVIEQKGIKLVTEQWGSPTNTRDLAEAIALLIEKPLFGTYHLTNSGSASRQDVAEKIFAVMGKRCPVELLDKKDKVYFARRPSNSTLTDYAWRLSGFEPLRSWENALESFVRQYVTRIA